jgi:hypothetical protein
VFVSCANDAGRANETSTRMNVRLVQPQTMPGAQTTRLDIVADHWQRPVCGTGVARSLVELVPATRRRQLVWYGW